MLQGVAGDGGRSPANVVLLDTDVYSYIRYEKTFASAYRPHVEGRHIALSYITIGELYHGAAKCGWGQGKLNALEAGLATVIILSFDIEICRAYAEIRSLLERAGTRLDDHDLWIAACAIRNSIPLISNNRSHFERVSGLTLISESPSLARGRPRRR